MLSKKSYRFYSDFVLFPAALINRTCRALSNKLVHIEFRIGDHVNLFGLPVLRLFLFLLLGLLGPGVGLCPLGSGLIHVYRILFVLLRPMDDKNDYQDNNDNENKDEDSQHYVKSCVGAALCRALRVLVAHDLG